MGEGWARWVACTLILAVVYAVMGRVGMARGKVAPRSYRYAE
jgi:hypothetical protein